MRLHRTSLVYTPMKDRAKPTTMNGVMHKLIVFEIETTAIVGYGYIIHFSDGRTSKPELFDFAGGRLPGGTYQLQTIDEQFNVVVPRNVQ